MKNLTGQLSGGIFPLSTMHMHKGKVNWIKYIWIVLRDHTIWVQMKLFQSSQNCLRTSSVPLQMIIYTSFFLLYCLCCYSCSHCFSLSPPPLSPTLTPPQVNLHIVVHVHGLCTNVLWLINPFSIFHPVPSCSFLASLSLFYVSKLLLLFCLLVYCAHYIPHIGEIMWYLSFTDWLNSFSMIISRSIHAVKKM